MSGKQKLPSLFSGLVVIARAKHPIPSRTRPLSAVAPMVLRLKTWESRSPPNLKRDTSLLNDDNPPVRKKCPRENGAGWSSPVARQAHNLKVTGSNPVPATKNTNDIRYLQSAPRGGVCVSKIRGSTVESRGREVLGNNSKIKNPHFMLHRQMMVRRPPL